MGKNWNFFEERLSKQVEVTPIKACPKRVAVCRISSEKARLDCEVAQRFDEVVKIKTTKPELSPVEQAMRRNAPDLAGAPEEEVRAAAARRKAHLEAKWPRPRLAALVVIGLIMWLHPLATIRLFACGFFLFLVAAVAIGPERARDGSFFLWRRLLRYWKVELALAKRLFGKFSHHPPSNVEPAE